MGIKNDKIRNFFLGFLVLLSFLLSYNLWTAGRMMGEEEMTSGQTSLSNVSMTTHSASETFRPSLIALHGVDSENQLLVGRSYPLRNLLSELTETQNLDQIEQTVIQGYEDYLNERESGRWLEFVYNEEQPIGLLAQKFETISQDTSNNFYDRISVDLDNPNAVYFYHTDSETTYIASTIEGEELILDPFLNEENITYVGAFSMALANNIVYLPSETIDIPNRRYVSAQLPNSVYLSNFFPDTSLVDRRSTANITRFIDLTKEVVINENTHTLNYLRQISDSGELNPTTRFERSFDQVNRFENWSDTFVLSSYDRENQIIHFQREIEGYPVFSVNGYDTITEVGLVEPGVTHLKLPLRYIDTPITIQGAPSEELMSGEDLINQLSEATSGNIYNQIDNLSIGYSWDESQEDSQVVNFNPEWFILIEDSWMTVEEYLELSEEAADGL